MGVRDGRRQRGGRPWPRGAGRGQRRRGDTEDEDSESDSDDHDVEEEEEEESEDGPLDKRKRSHRRCSQAEEDEDDDDRDSEDCGLDGMGGQDAVDEDVDEDEANQSDSEPEPPVLLVSDLNDDLLNGSYLTVTLQRPPKAKRDPGAIVPKLEAAVSPRAPPSSQGYVQRKSLQRLRQKNGTAGNGLMLARGGGAPGGGRLPRSQGRSYSEAHALDGDEASTSSSSRSSASPTPPPPTTSSSPPSLLSLPSFKDVGNEPGCEKEVWVSVFRYLTRAELCVCMTVCKSWYKW